MQIVTQDGCNHDPTLMVLLEPNYVVRVMEDIDSFSSQPDHGSPQEEWEL